MRTGLIAKKIGMTSYFNDDGSRSSMELAVGDTVVYSKYGGTEYREGDIEYLVLREDDVLLKK